MFKLYTQQSKDKYPVVNIVRTFQDYSYYRVCIFKRIVSVNLGLDNIQYIKLET